jgi:hypothetical protein
MTAKTKSCETTKMAWLPPLFKGYIYSTVALCGAIGAMLLLITWTCKVRGIQPYLNSQASLFGLSNRMVLLLAGTLQLLFGGCLFVARSVTTQGLLVLWAGLNGLLYRIVMVWAMNMTVPLPREGFVGWRLGVRPETVDLCWKLYTAYLVFGSSTFMLFRLWQWKQLKDEAWVKQWQETRNQINSQTKSVNQKLPAKAADYLKISCPSCCGHIEFPTHALGQSVLCPHCKMEITLKEPI